MKNTNLSLLDVAQMSMRVFDESHDAQRVILVGGDDISQSIVTAVKDSLKDLKVTVDQAPQHSPIAEFNNTEPLIIKIPYQTVVKEVEIKEIEKPVFIEKFSIVEVEKPVIITKTEVITVEKQIIVTQYKDIPQIVYWLFGAQLIISLITAIFHK